MMLLKPLALVATAAAILIPEISEADEGVFRTLPIDTETLEIPATALAQTVDVPCKQCRGRNTHLQLDFLVEDSTRLTLNGFELYPRADPWQGDLTATVIRGNGNEKERKLGYSLAIIPEGVDEDQQLGVIGVELRVIEVGNRFVEGVPSIKVKLIKAPAGDILIGSVSIEDSVEGSDEECTTIKCRIDSMIDDAWEKVKGSVKSGFKGCHGQKGADGQPDSEYEEIGQDLGSLDDYDSSIRDADHSRSAFHIMLKNLTSYVLFPILLGVTAGVGTAFLAMFLGSLAYRVARFVRCSECQVPAGSSHKVADVEAVYEEDEKSGLMSKQDPPPQYEEEHTRN